MFHPDPVLWLPLPPTPRNLQVRLLPVLLLHTHRTAWAGSAFHHHICSPAGRNREQDITATIWKDSFYFLHLPCTWEIRTLVKPRNHAGDHNQVSKLMEV